MKRWLSPIIVLMAVLGAACSREVRADGGTGVKEAADKPGDVVARAGDSHVMAPAPFDTPKYREVTIPVGTRLGVRLNTSVASNASRVEDPVDATLIAPVKIGQSQVIPAGSHVKGYVSSARQSGKVKGRASLAIRFQSLTVGSESYPIAAQISRIAPATKKQDAEKIGIPAAGGAGIGALVGGKEGAAIGAAVGGGAGTAVVLSTRGKEVSLPHGSVLSLRLQRAVTVRVPNK
jgi:hypothetical protein